MKNNLQSEVKENKLLSICIPTFNRAQYLKNTLNNIIEQKKFSESCEIIISDNNSTDKTRDVGEYFSEKYENVRYYCNETNIGADRNFLKLLNYGQGKYLKLHNDRACFYEQKLGALVEYLDSADQDVIFILNEHTDFPKKGIIECNSFDEFIRLVSVWSTWMNGMILNKEKYSNLQNKDRKIGSNLIQTDIMFRMLENCGSSLIINERLLYDQDVTAKSGYNFFDVFLNKYFSLYDEYLLSGNLSKKTFKEEKVKILRYFVFPFYTRMILINDKHFKFDMSKTHQNIFKHYWREPILWFYPLYLLTNGFSKIINYFTHKKDRERTEAI